ncbi:MAG: DNA repair protein RecO [Bacteroidota bacterium]|nr:DNA repair protein RecO [Bacteroidota bacterium]
MSIVKTDAFVLKSFNYGDTSKIVTLFTKEFGKLNAIVKGARNYKSKLCGTLETMNYISCVIYFKENRELQLISKSEYIKSFQNILADFEKLQTAFKIIEILNKSVIEREINDKIFELLISSYEKLNLTSANSLKSLLRFQIELVKILGLSPDFSAQNYDLETFYKFNELNANKYFYDILITINMNGLGATDLNTTDLISLVNCYETYILSHTQGNKFYKSTRVFQELNQSF